MLKSKGKPTPFAADTFASLSAGSGFALRGRGGFASKGSGLRWSLASPALPLTLVVGRLGSPTQYPNLRSLRSTMIKSKSGHLLVIGNIQKYQDRLNFTVTNVGLPEVIVNRLYLQLSRYVHCPHCLSEHCIAMSMAEALILSTEYELPLTGDYSQYDLIPLTPDNARNTFIYKDGDSDFLG